MSFLNFFKPVKTITMDEFREMIKDKKPGEYCILDVRQPEEFAKGHIPGAILVPVSQLPDRLCELDIKKPTFVYCAMGSRSHTATSILQDAGFYAAYNLKGGFNAYLR